MTTTYSITEQPCCMLPGLPSSFKQPIIKGAEYYHLIENFGSAVVQSVGTKQVNLTRHSLQWHGGQKKLLCHHNAGPGLFTRIMINDALTENLPGVGDVTVGIMEFFSVIGSSFSSSLMPYDPGEYNSVGLWWSADFIREMVYQYPSLEGCFAEIIAGYPAKIAGITFSLSASMSDILQELLRFDYTTPGAARFQNEKMKKLCRLILDESTDLKKRRKKCSTYMWNKVVIIKEDIEENPFVEINIKQLAIKNAMSESVIKRGIRQLTGMGLEEFRKTQMLTEIGRRIILYDEPIQNLADVGGYSAPTNFTRAFKRVFGRAPTELRNQFWGTRKRVDYVISEEDKYKYGSMIARYMGNRENKEDIHLLNRWLLENENHLQLFDNLLDDTKTDWAKQWLDVVGVKHNFIKWKKDGGWYKYENTRKELIEFYVVALFAALMMVYFYLVLMYKSESWNI